MGGGGGRKNGFIMADGYRGYVQDGDEVRPAAVAAHGS